MMLRTAKRKRPCTAAAGRTTSALARNGSRLYVSDWAGRTVLALDPGTLRTVAQDRRRRASQPDRRSPQGRSALRRLRLEQLRVGDRHPARHRHRDDLARPCSRRRPKGARPTPWPSRPTARRSTSPTPTTTASPSSTSPRPDRSQVKGFIPTGWYPTAVAVTPDGKTLLVGVGKGNQTKANPIDDGPSRRRRREPAASRGAAVPVHRHDALGRAVDRAGARREDSWPPTPRRSTGTAPTPTSCSPTPRTREDGHPDQGRRPVADQARASTSSRRTAPTTRSSATCTQGNGDPSLVMFGEKVTPNHHKLAEEFVLLDNLYCNGQVSARRPSLVDDGLQHRLHRPRLGPDLLAARRASTTTTRAIWRTRPRAISGTPAPGTGSAIAATANTAGASASRTARSRWKARVPGPGRPHVPRLTASPRCRASRSRDTDNVDDVPRRSSASSRRTATCRASSS